VAVDVAAGMSTGKVGFRASVELLMDVGRRAGLSSASFEGLGALGARAGSFLELALSRARSSG
jgi:hypothetical protein